jgi:hypothetical protein
MNQKIFWTIFVVVQSIGASVVLLLVDAAHSPIALFDYAFPVAVASLCPGLFVSSWLLDTPQLQSQDGGIVSLAIVFNAIFWFGVFATTREIRRWYERVIGAFMNPQRGRKIRPNILTGLAVIIAMFLLYDGLFWRVWWYPAGMNLIPARIMFVTLQALGLGGIVLLARRLVVNENFPSD